MARAALMIVLPLLVLQISGGVLIVQRYFDLVTKQLTGAVVFDIQYLEQNAKDAEEFRERLHDYDYDPIEHAPLTENRFGFADLSGHYILQTFESNYSPEVRIDSSDRQNIIIQLPSRFGLQMVVITRSKLAPVNPHQILLNTTAFSLIALLVVVLFLRNQVRSIRQLSHAAEAFGRGETIPYEPSGATEIRLAGRNFIAMRARINRQREQRALMLSGISHDLRTPLTRFRLGVEMVDDEAMREELAHDVNDMENLIDSFLNYAATAAREEHESIELREYIDDILQDEADIHIGEIPKVTLSIRPFLLRRAILNLIGNAKRFGERVEIHARATRKLVHIYIDDDGPGIDSEHHQEALTAFKRLDSSRNQDKGAHAGLGLAIAFDAVRQQGGELRLERSPLGGLRALIEIPVQSRARK